MRPQYHHATVWPHPVLNAHESQDEDLRAASSALGQLAQFLFGEKDHVCAFGHWYPRVSCHSSHFCGVAPVSRLQSLSPIRSAAPDHGTPLGEWFDRDHDVFIAQMLALTENHPVAAIPILGN